MDNALFPIEERQELLTLEQAAERPRITPKTLLRWVRQGKFPALVNDTETQQVNYTVSRKVKRVRSEDLRLYLQSRGQSARPIDRAQAA